MTTHESPYLQKLADLLASRDAPVLPLLEAVTVAGTSDVYVAASTMSRRIDLLLPYSEAALKAAAVDVEHAPERTRGMLRVSADGPRLDAAHVVVGVATAVEAVAAVSPEAAPGAWLNVVESMTTIAGATVSSRSRWLTRRRGSIAVQYPARTDAEDEALFDRVDDVGHALHISTVLREQWKHCARATVPGEPVTISTSCSATGPLSELGITYRTLRWEAAVQLARVLLDRDNANHSAAALGSIAGILQRDEIKAIEIVLEPRGVPDLVVWLTLR